MPDHPPIRRLSRLTFRQRLERFPPILIRLLTTIGKRPNVTCPTDRELARLSGLSISDIKRISYELTWERVEVGAMYRFLDGCGIDLEKRRTFRRLEWMRKSGYFRHLKKSPIFENQFREMLDLWAGLES